MSVTEFVISAVFFVGAALALYVLLRLGVAVLLKGLRQISDRPEGAESMANPLELLAMALSFHVALHLVYHEPDRVFRGWSVVNELSKTFLFFALVWVGIRMLAAFIHSLYIADHATSRVPLLLEKIINSLLYGTTALLILHFYFGFDVSWILGVGAVVSIVGGIAFQDTLRSVFAGISLNLDDAFHVGDLVQVANFKGIVVDTDWRTTMLRSLHNDFVTIPNRNILEAPIINFHRPERRHRSRLVCEVSAAASPAEARRALCACALMAEGVLSDPAPEALLGGLSEERAQYTLWFSIEDYTDNERIENRIRSLCWYRLGRRGLLQGGPRAQIETPALLKQLQRFSKLDDKTREALAAYGRPGRYGPGERLGMAEESGAAYFIVSGGVEWRESVKSEETIQKSLGPGAALLGESLSAGEAEAVVSEESLLICVGAEAPEELKSALQKLS